jgi:hypothetical protein
LAAAKAATGIDETLSFIIVKARGVAIVVIAVVVVVVVVNAVIVAVIVAVVVVVVVAVVVVVVVVVATKVLFHSIEAFVDVVELNTEVVNFHRGRLGGGRGEGGEGGNERSRAVGRGIGFERINAIHLSCIVEEIREGDVRVLEDIALDQLLQSQGTVVDEGCLGELINSVFGRVIGSVAKESTQEILECSEKGRKIACHTKGGEGTAAVTSEVVRNVLFLKDRGKLRLEVAGVSETTSIKPAGRARGVQVGESMRCAIGFVNLGEGKVAIDGK